MRHVGILYFLNECSIKYNDPNIKKIPFNTLDKGRERKEYSMTYDKRKPYLKQYCGPDWTFYFWKCSSVDSFEETVKEIMYNADIPPTINRIAWYGNIYSPLPNTVEYKTRPLLKKIGDKHPDIFHVVHVEPIKNEKNNQLIGKHNPNYISMPELTKYTFLLDIGGNGYSGRLKYLMYTKRPILYVDRYYVEYFQDDLIPYVHYIPVKMDLSDIWIQIRWIMSNPEKCKEIALNAFEYATTHFTKDKLIDRVYEVYQKIK
jgi:hypothetical protein